MPKDIKSGMAFRYDIHLPEKPNLLQKGQYAEFAGMRVATEWLGKTTSTLGLLTEGVGY